ncbi:PepSY domain-containing protein, partial [Neisseria gonorrhoeae]
MKKLLLAAVVSLNAATAFAGDSAERQIYGDP